MPGKDNHTGKEVVVTYHNKTATGILQAQDTYMNVVIKTATSTLFIRGSTIQEIQLKE
ncbi:hypothetical protein NEDG_01963 [Nematocida displodere]|uniref:LSM domain-containing protein n=1 Tax=Nematocida displodere TaxID=1805483 RepID=A0A177EI81_9MICR|nr:hypothetical protein NEDG_01963 [Nematocida displodere]